MAKLFNTIPYYWLNHSVGRPLANAAEVFEKAYLSAWQEREPWPLWLEQIEGFRSQVGQLLGVEATEVSPQVNISSALVKLLGSFGDRPLTVLLAEEDFPTISFVASKAPNCELTFIPRGLDLSDEQTWAPYLNDQVDLALITHSYSNTGQRAPVKALLERCRAHRIFSVVDIAQSVGVIDIAAESWDFDCLLGTSVKWLCGGSGAAFMVLSSKHVSTLEPTDVGWFSHRNPFEFDPHHFEYASDANRFWGGTPSVVPFVMAANAIRELRNIGIANIQAHNRLLSELILEQLPQTWRFSPEDHSRRGGTLVIDVPNDQLAAVASNLEKLGVGFDQRGHGIRLSPHIYNSQEEAAAIAACFS